MDIGGLRGEKVCKKANACKQEMSDENKESVHIHSVQHDKDRSLIRLPSCLVSYPLSFSQDLLNPVTANPPACYDILVGSSVL